MDADAKLQERVGLRAQTLGHLLEADEVMAQTRMALQHRCYFAPHLHEARSVNEPREILRKQRRVVIAKPGTEPGELP